MRNLAKAIAIVALLASQSGLAMALDNGQILKQAKDEMAWEPNKPAEIRSWGNLPKAKSLLLSIGQSSKEYPEAQALLDQVLEREKQAAKISGKLQAERTVSERDEFAQKIELALVRDGYDISVSTSGKGKVKLRLQWILMGRVLMQRMVDTGLLDNARKHGFTHVIFSDGDSSWTYTL